MNDYNTSSISQISRLGMVFSNTIPNHINSGWNYLQRWVRQCTVYVRRCSPPWPCTFRRPRWRPLVCAGSGHPLREGLQSPENWRSLSHCGTTGPLEPECQTHGWRIGRSRPPSPPLSSAAPRSPVEPLHLETEPNAILEVNVSSKSNAIPQEANQTCHTFINRQTDRLTDRNSFPSLRFWMLQ